MSSNLANPFWVPVKALCRSSRRIFCSSAIATTNLTEKVKKDENDVLVVVGGGAAGVYGAIRAKTLSPDLRVLVIEKGKFLSKVKISGGGRCNVTNGHCNDTIRLSEHYPRGHKELKGSFFYTHGPADTMSWFTDHGVPLKIEDDGRVFPVSDNSSSVIDCLLNEANTRGVRLERGKSVLSASIKPDGKFLVKVGKRSVDTFESIEASYLLIATGSSQQGYSLATQFGHSIVDPVPSLFTFKINDPLLTELAGISFSKVQAKLKLDNPPPDLSKLVQIGPMLVTHWGLSGPVILRLSAWGARYLFSSVYKGLLIVDFIPDINIETAKSLLKQHKLQFSKHKVSNSFPPQFGLVNRFWRYILDREGSSRDTLWASLSNNSLNAISDLLKHCTFQVTGKGQYKDEFVTAGGVPLSEISLKTMESKLVPNLFFAGEVLNVDGVTGGFNFQNAWSSGYIAGTHIGKLARPRLTITDGFCSVPIVDNEDISCERFNVELEDKKPKSALYNRLIRRREALVYNTPDDHRLKFLGVPFSAMTANVLARTQFALLIIDGWLLQKPLHAFGFGDPIAISAETGLDICSQEDVQSDENLSDEIDESKFPLQLAIVGKPNVGKSTLLNALLEEERVLVGPEAGLTKDPVRVQFEFQGRTVYLVDDTAGWLERTERDKGPASLSIMPSRKSLMRAHVIVLVLDAAEVIKARCSMTHSEVVIARRAVEEGHGLVVIVNKMDCLRGKQNSDMYKKIKEAVPIEVQTVIPQITGIPVVWCSRLSMSTSSASHGSCFLRPRNGFSSVSFSRDASGEKVLLLGPGRSTVADEKWDELLTRASSRRLEIKLKKKCDRNYKFSQKLISFMNWLQRLKCNLMHFFTSEEETPKSYDSASASRALARLLGPLIIAALLYCAKEIVSKLWDVHKEKKMQLALNDRFNDHREKVLKTADFR
ncbi:putative tRNA modification GTPase MnmE [Cardamine amara subsp. amara]|uniref:tRNA modification GTPase MnmE n=1 Tax=Cardamine amara subsp. amara TaxID=228776 RepID=A0ABD1AH61_CARAN